MTEQEVDRRIAETRAVLEAVLENSDGFGDEFVLMAAEVLLDELALGASRIPSLLASIPSPDTGDWPTSEQFAEVARLVKQRGATVLEIHVWPPHPHSICPEVGVTMNWLRGDGQHQVTGKAETLRAAASVLIQRLQNEVREEEEKSNAKSEIVPGE